MALILCLETATTVCSVALEKDGVLLAMREVNAGYTHSENLTVFAEQVLKEAGCSFADLDAVAVSKGPGSYTGLRIGVSAAKGFCYAIGKPLIAINTLRAMASGVAEMIDLTLTLSGGEGIGEIGNVQDAKARYYTATPQDWKKLVEYAKQNMKEPTYTEQVMWQQLRKSRLGFKFRRQYPVGKFIPDFVCIEKRLIIEIDGISHTGKEKRDGSRTKELEALGYRVIRFTDDEVRDELDQVMEEIKTSLTAYTLGEDQNSFSDEHEKYGSLEKGRGDVILCPMIDARRMEVYCAMYDTEGNEVQETRAEIIDENSFSGVLKDRKILFFGDGAAKCKPKLEKNENAAFFEDVFPSAAFLVSLAEEKFNKGKLEDVAYFEPYYLKDFVAGAKK
jgi:tRNA threonylcarbamoyl adenosine modification protein YeaZ